MVDFGDDLDVMAAVVVRRPAGRKELGQPAEVLGAEYDVNAGRLMHRFQVAPTVARQYDAAGSGWHVQAGGDPGGGQQGRDRDVQHFDRVIEPDARSEFGQDPPQRGFGQPASNEMDLLAGHRPHYASVGQSAAPVVDTPFAERAVAMPD